MHRIPIVDVDRILVQRPHCVLKIACRDVVTRQCSAAVLVPLLRTRPSAGQRADQSRSPARTAFRPLNWFVFFLCLAQAMDNFDLSLNMQDQGQESAATQSYLDQVRNCAFASPASLWNATSCRRRSGGGRCLVRGPKYHTPPPPPPSVKPSGNVRTHTHLSFPRLGPSLGGRDT